ncbi:MAG: hypothetical protein ACKPKO_63770, partial [Candidatus Fonsibacter sp.]
MNTSMNPIIYNARVGTMLWNEICRQCVQGSWYGWCRWIGTCRRTFARISVAYDYNTYNPYDFDFVWASPPC